MNEFLDYVLIRFNTYKLTVGNIVTVVLVLLLTKILLWFFKRFMYKRLSSEVEKGQRQAIIQLVKYIAWITAVILCFQAAGIQISFLLAGSAALLVGIGLGLQQTFNDFISGFILLVDHTIKVGDVIEIDGWVARVEHIGIRTSNLISRDDISVIVPNHRITGQNVINWSHSTTEARFYISIGVAYGSDEQLVKKLLLETVSENENICTQPAPIVRLEEFASSSINFKLLFWTKEVFRVENVKSDLRFRIIEKFRQQDISIPFPQLDVHLKQPLNT